MPFVLLVEGQRERERERAWLFEGPSQIVCCREQAEVVNCLELCDEAVKAGKYVAGALAYEAGYALHPKLSWLTPHAPAEHLVWFGVFDERRELLSEELSRFLLARGAGEPAQLSQVRFDQAAADYALDFERIQEHLQAGDSYQVCKSIRCHFQFEGPAAALFSRLRARQVTAFSALIFSGEYSILSLSPELFFRKRGSCIELRPMKGTCRRGQDDREDALLAARLRSDPKTRAENVMIVDLLRSDIGRLALAGSVKVPELFAVESYETVLQMTSSVVATVPAALGLVELMRSLFPSGSVTGAPKLRTMEIIHELEATARGIFCGSIGYVTPDNDACFNVAIRSLLLTQQGRGSLGIGGGVVVDSTSQSEFEECLLKAEFLVSEAT